MVFESNHGYIFEVSGCSDATMFGRIRCRATAVMVAPLSHNLANKQQTTVTGRAMSPAPSNCRLTTGGYRRSHDVRYNDYVHADDIDLRFYFESIQVVRTYPVLSVIALLIQVVPRYSRAGICNGSSTTLFLLS
jgi:hypothetical protein